MKKREILSLAESQRLRNELVAAGKMPRSFAYPEVVEFNLRELPGPEDYLPAPVPYTLKKK